MIPINTIVTITKLGSVEEEFIQIYNMPHIPKIGEEFLFCSIRDEAGNYPASIEPKRYITSFSGVVFKISHSIEELGTDSSDVHFNHHIEIHVS